MAKRLVCHLVLLSQRPLGRQLVLELADFDPGGNVISDLDISEVGSHRVDKWHLINVGSLLAA